jgi:hypothetical protein
VYFENKKYDTLGSPLLLEGGDLALRIALIFIIQFIVIAISIGFFLSQKTEIPESNQKFQNETIIDNKRIADRYASLSFCILLVNLNNYHFNYYGTSLPRTYLFMTFTGLVVISIVFFEIVKKKSIFKYFSTQVTCVMGCLIFGLTYFLRNSVIDLRLGLFTLNIFILLALILIPRRKIWFLYVSLEGRIAFLYILSFSFFLHSRIYGDIKNLHAFESFSVSNAQLLNQGSLPWRDFGVQHGLWESGFREYLGGFLTTHTIWGQLNASSSFINPIVVCLSAFSIYLLSKNLSLTLVFIAMDSFLTRTLDLSIFSQDLFPVFIIVILLKKYFRNPSVRNLLAIGALSGVAIIWNSELIFMTFGTSIAILIFLRLSGASKGLLFKNILIFLTAIATTLVLILNPRIFQFMLRAIKLDGSGYLFAWGMNYQWQLGILYQLLFFAVPILLLSFFSFMFLGIFKKSKPLINYLHLLPVACLSIYLYLKFLNWADWHLTQPTNAILVLIVFSVCLINVNKSIQHLSIFLIIILSIPALSVSISDLNYKKSQSFDAVVGNYDPNSFSYFTRVHEVNRGFLPYMPKRPSIYLLDLGNEPVTWFGMLEYKTIGGVDKVLNIASRDAQAVVINRLRERKPDGVIWGGEFGYWNNIFNGTMLRQYKLVQFVLENYVPVTSNGKYVLMLPKDGQLFDGIAKKVMMAESCNWMSGSQNFETPINEKNIQKGLFNQNFLNGETLLIESSSKFTKFGFFASSPADVKVTLQGTGNTVGEIKFSITGNAEPKFIWLASCASWFYQFRNSSWKIMTDQNSPIKIESGFIAK